MIKLMGWSLVVMFLIAGLTNYGFVDLSNGIFRLEVDFNFMMEIYNDI
jgi:hypothetical protein